MSPRRWRPAGPAERGYVTAEAALVLPSLVGLGLALAFVVAAMADQVRCTDAAWEAARLVARGETESHAALLAGRLAPSTAVVRISPGGGAVAARVTVRLAPLGPLLPALSISGAAQIACEEGEPCGSAVPVTAPVVVRTGAPR
jgi:Flp pilus assembly protein TadG